MLQKAVVRRQQDSIFRALDSTTANPGLYTQPRISFRCWREINMLSYKWQSLLGTKVHCGEKKIVKGIYSSHWRNVIHTVAQIYEEEWTVNVRSGTKDRSPSLKFMRGGEETETRDEAKAMDNQWRSNLSLPYVTIWRWSDKPLLHSLLSSWHICMGVF